MRHCNAAGLTFEMKMPGLIVHKSSTCELKSLVIHYNELVRSILLCSIVELSYEI